jgi:protein SCO1/2
MNSYTVYRRLFSGFTQAAIMGLSFVSGAQAHDAHDHAAMMAADVVRSVVSVDVPATKMVRQDGVGTTAAKELVNGKPTILAFIYTSCTTVCPLTSQILSAVQDKLGKDLDKTQLVSISIDPEYDTPARLSAYAKKFGASPQWQYYTGSLSNSVAIQKAFKAYQGDKMNHLPLIFVNGGNSKSWVRLEGFPKAESVVKELAMQTGQ